MTEQVTAAETPEEAATPTAPEPEKTEQQETAKDPASEPGSSLDDQLDAAYDRVRSPKEPEAPAKEEQKEDTAKADDKTSEPEKDAEQEDEGESESPETPAIEPPLSWSKEAKAKWADIPPEAQQIIAGREKDAHAAITKLGQEVKAFEPLRETIHQYSDVFKANNLEPAQGVARLLEVQSMLDKDPVNGMRQIAKAYNVDLAEFAFEDLQENAPEITSLQNKITELEQRLESRDKADHERAQQQYQAEAAKMQDIVKQFAADKPHFERLQQNIQANVKAIIDTNPDINPSEALSRAYEMAVYQDDGLRAEMIKKQTDEAEKAALEKARKAQQAAGLNVSSAQSSTPVKVDLDDELDSIWNKGARA